ncbi:tyrosyl-DNA phosphodiesterase I [Zychaea mexicana]|uniref:tyrosyl-DNA phosphodiesterase I n=1 Tax=Zychaea mexicana TaxID=64656 RepID=UPI0022FE1F73|nr:tyrosyl-DNA phosphodiesterase I [Zychaea mexicana]KAI9494314.1 tyrosyl-DNA phosphodiesterase I [Zychaea mexicana]
MVVSTDWIEAQFPSDINLCIILHGRPAMTRQLGPNRVFIMPPMKDERFGVFHPKLMLLVHESSLRVVIGSANLERYDYNDLENVVFIQDFPLLTKHVDSADRLPEFAREIYDLLCHMHVPSSVKTELFKYDFSRAKARVVASVSGVFEGDDQYKRYGHARLAQVIKDIGAADPSRPPQVEMQTSSLGGLNISYLHELHRTFSGMDPYANGGKTPRQSKTNELPPIDIVYPSRDTVEDSVLGPPGAGTICLNTSSWRKSTFPKQVMCDAISHREGTLMHSKVCMMLYIKSHNATMGAWGKLSLSKNSKKPKMAINNWELGVVLPLYEDSNIPVTYVRPPPRYKPSQNAWTQDAEWS